MFFNVKHTKRKKTVQKKQGNPLFFLFFAFFALCIGFVVISAPKETKVEVQAEVEEKETFTFGATVRKGKLFDKNYIYLAYNDTYPIKDSEKCEFRFSENGIIRIENGEVIPVSTGVVSLRVFRDGIYDDITFDISDLYVKPQIVRYKPYLKENQYTKEENDYLDAVLSDRVKEAGYGTRAGAVAAARFLTLEFPYFVSYFDENGRLDLSTGRVLCDGEGRYYHEGLYLSPSRYENLVRSIAGPAYWGKMSYSYSSEIAYANGLDCSGFVTWSLRNGGLDPGDIGVGPNPYSKKTLVDIGPLHKIGPDNVHDILPGDLINADGHITICIGTDEDNIYLGEAYNGNVHVTTLSYNAMAYSKFWLNYVDMSDFYEKEGNLTLMWD